MAEASVTIDNIVYVVDCGYSKVRVYHPDTDLDSLLLMPLSKASAQQRAGRAGRVRSGKAYRLYTEATYETLLPNSIPDLQKCNWTPIILQLKALGVKNVLRFKYLSPPPIALMMRALEHLYALGVLDMKAQLTKPLGIQMAELPVDALLAKTLLLSGQYNCSEEMLTVAAMLSVQVSQLIQLLFTRTTPYNRRMFL